MPQRVRRKRPRSRPPRHCPCRQRRVLPARRHLQPARAAALVGAVVSVSGRRTLRPRPWLPQPPQLLGRGHHQRPKPLEPCAQPTPWLRRPCARHRQKRLGPCLAAYQARHGPRPPLPTACPLPLHHRSRPPAARTPPQPLPRVPRLRQAPQRRAPLPRPLSLARRRWRQKRLPWRRAGPQGAQAAAQALKVESEIVAAQSARAAPCSRPATAKLRAWGPAPRASGRPG
mmetsp:Transcript_95708/g.270609  ORF Transcript_95708/g.270609 Transcript_95708/m.270609 type:complete len:229 (-) Transcript_95708:18-704(-)